MKNSSIAEKVAKKRLGEGNPNWRGGQAKRSRYGRQRLKRIGLISSCWLCRSSKYINVHHLDNNPKNNNLTNLLVICTKCHAKFHNWSANGFKKGNTLWKLKKGEEKTDGI